jgi:hypothetical protein
MGCSCWWKFSLKRFHDDFVPRRFYASRKRVLADANCAAEEQSGMDIGGSLWLVIDVVFVALLATGIDRVYRD